MLTKTLFRVLLCGVSAGAISYAATQAPPRGAKPAPPPKPAAQRQRTPTEQARDEWNRGAVAYRAGRFAEARRHFERVRELDPKMKDVRLYIVRSIHQQYRPGVEDAENIARGEEAVTAYEALLADEPANDDAFKGLVGLLGQMRSPERLRDAVMRRANDASLPVAKRVEALMPLAAADLKCSRDVTERNKEAAAEQAGKTTTRYKMPADTGEFYRAQQCATNGLGYVEQALQLAPDETRALTTRAGFLRELSKLAEMEGNTGQKDFYDAQHAEMAQRLRGLGLLPPAGSANAAAGLPSEDVAAPGNADGNAAAADGPIGIPECDQYLAAYESCLTEKVPESARAMFGTSLTQMRKSWRQAAATPANREGLVRACTVAREQARQSLATYGCVF
jgi:tetratricopeptide (TPR) repeat protein